MFKTDLIKLITVLAIISGIATSIVYAQRPSRPPLSEIIKKRIDEQRGDDQDEASQERRPDLRETLKKRLDRKPKLKWDWRQELREVVNDRLATLGIEPQGQAVVRRLEANSIAAAIGDDGVRELRKQGFGLPGANLIDPDSGRRLVIMPNEPIEFSQRLGVLKQVLPNAADARFGDRVKIEAYWFRHVVLIKLTNQRTGRVRWIVRQRTPLFGAGIVVVHHDAAMLSNALDTIRGGEPWKTFLQLDELAEIQPPPAEVPADEETPANEAIPVETQKQLIGILKRFEQVRDDPRYAMITNLPEFQTTYENLRALTDSFQRPEEAVAPPEP